jgi:hypothetical protein
MLVARVEAKLEPGGAQLSLLRVVRVLAGGGHRVRLLAGIASPAGVETARAHGVEPEVMGAGVDLQWHCDPAFVAWPEPRLGGADVVHAHMLGAWWAAAHHALTGGVAPGVCARRASPVIADTARPSVQRGIRDGHRGLMGDTGLEPVTSALSRRRSPS